MADEITKQYESAARIYCAKLGLDPDEEMTHPHPFVQGVMCKTPRWEFAASDLIDFSLRLTSLREAAQLAQAQRKGQNGKIITHA